MLFTTTDLKKLLLFMGIFASVIQQMPGIKEMLYDEIRVGLYILFGTLALLSVIRINVRQTPNILKTYLICSLVWLLFIGIFILFKLRLSTPYNNIDWYELFIPLGLLITSITISLNQAEVKRLIIIYGLLSMIMGITSLYAYGQGFSLMSAYMFGISKNQIGPMLSISVISFAYLSILNSSIGKNKSWLRGIFLCLCIICLYCLIIIRNRAGIISSAICITIIFIIKLVHQKSLMHLLLSIFIGIILITLGIRYLRTFWNFIYDSMTLNFNVYDVDRLSANRIRTYYEAVEFIHRFPLLGELESKDYIYGISHNYIMNKLVKYGVIGSMPLIFLFINLVYYLFSSVIKEIKTNKTIPLGLLIFLQAILLSNIEYSYPFGPGVSQLLTWVLLGQYMLSANNRTSKHNNRSIFLLAQ